MTPRRRSRPSKEELQVAVNTIAGRERAIRAICTLQARCSDPSPPEQQPAADHPCPPTLQGLVRQHAARRKYEQQLQERKQARAHRGVACRLCLLSSTSTRPPLPIPPAQALAYISWPVFLLTLAILASASLAIVLADKQSPHFEDMPELLVSFWYFLCAGPAIFVLLMDLVRAVTLAPLSPLDLRTHAPAPPTRAQ